EQSLIAGLLALVQLWWAYRLYRIFRKNSQFATPDRAALKVYDDLQLAVQRYKVDDGDRPDFIQLQIGRGWWQGFLLHDRAVLASRQSTALLTAPQDKTTFTFRDGNGVFGKRIAGTLDFNGIRFNRITFPPTTIANYNRWKGVADAQTSEWLNALDLN